MERLKLLQNLNLHGKEGRSQPKYLHLKNQLLAELHAGRLKPGQPLPSEEAVANELQVARSTVRQAFAELQRDGVLRRVQGTGTFVDEKACVQIRKGTDVFGLVLPSTRSGYYPSLQHGFEFACKESHNQMIVCCSENNLTKQSDVIVQLLDKDVGGIAMVPAPCAPTPVYQVRQIRERGVPLVFCHRGVEGIQAPLLAIPFKEVGRLAGEALAKQGHRRVAFICIRASDATRAYEAGLREVMTAWGGELSDEFVCHLGVSHADALGSEEAVLPVLEQMCCRADRPTAIMTGFDSESELIFLLLGQLGLKVPEDISLIGFGGSWREGAMLRRLAAVTVDETELGCKASRLLHQMRIGERPLDDQEKVAMPLSLSEGQTLDSPRATAEPNLTT